MKHGDENGTPPEGWVATTLGEILLDIQPGFASGKHTSDGAGLPHLRPMNVTREGRMDRTDLRSVSPDLVDRPSRRLRNGDVLFNNTNSLELVGKTALFEGEDEPAFSNHMTRLRVKEEAADPAFVAQLLHGRWKVGDFQRLANNHVSQASVGRAVLASLPIALPPLDEQRRIAARLDEVESRQAFVSARLNAARALLDRLRSAVLAAACCGRLTEDWRERHPDASSVGPALETKAATLSKSRKRETAIDLSMPDLPVNYVVTAIGAAARLMQYGTSKRCTALAEGGVPVLRMGNIQGGRLETSDLKYSDVDDDIERLLVQDGDLLFNRTNSPDLVGKSAVFHGDLPMSFASYLIRVRFLPMVANPDFVNLWMNSTYGRTWARLAKTDGVSQSNINATRLALMPIPLPPLAEQAEIVRRTAAALTTVDRLVGQTEQVRGTLERISRATLARAFRGELVPTEAFLASGATE